MALGLILGGLSLGLNLGAQRKAKREAKRSNAEQKRREAIFNLISAAQGRGVGPMAQLLPENGVDIGQALNAGLGTYGGIQQLEQASKSFDLKQEASELAKVRLGAYSGDNPALQQASDLASRSIEAEIAKSKSIITDNKADLAKLGVAPGTGDEGLTALAQRSEETNKLKNDLMKTQAEYNKMATEVGKANPKVAELIRVRGQLNQQFGKSFDQKVLDQIADIDAQLRAMGINVGSQGTVTQTTGPTIGGRTPSTQ